MGLNIIADHSVVSGFDVSQFQDPSRWVWDKLPPKFMIARASYGAVCPDKRFGAWASEIHNHCTTFGAYHFFRQTQSAVDQFRIFSKQVENAGGLIAGDLPPILDLEDNRTNGDGDASALLFNDRGRVLGSMMLEKWGRLLVYCSAYFPDVLGGHKNAGAWAWLRHPGIQLMIADYEAPAGKPRNPYNLPIAIHQIYQQHVSEAYPVTGNAGFVDPDILLMPIEKVVLPDPFACVDPWADPLASAEYLASAPTHPEAGVADWTREAMTARNGGALPDDDHAA